ncbi:hypothetical protein GCM10023187_05850 [Nibrella viscosa]|uniref:Peptidase metallopeptidase domain-containing protein n=1 Tax=Nibrella viscosa TaxID=1084524 RepID=A0ABP8JX04_9BACT
MAKKKKQSFTLPEGLTIGTQGSAVTTLQNYLKAFGYLQVDNPAEDSLGAMRAIGLETANDGQFDEITENALKKFQAFYGLPPTGRVDPDTLNLIQMPRCGTPDNPDRLFSVESSPQLAEFVASGNRWSKVNVTYSFQNFTGDLTQGVIIANIREAFFRWSNVCNLTFTETGANGDIIISFATGNHGDGFPFDGPGNVLAHAFYPPPGGGSLAGDLHFDDAETWTTAIPPPAGGTDFLTVAIHEIGHSLGLDHSAVTGAIMFAFYGGPKQNLHSDDIAGISSIYGARTAKATLSDTSVATPGFCSFNNQGFISWTGTNQQRNLNVMATSNLRVWHSKVILGETSLSGPSICVFKNRLVIAWRGVSNNQINVMSSGDGITWSNKVTLGETTFFRPALGVFNNRLVIAWTGTDAQRRLNIIQSTNGTAWTNKITLGDTSVDGPELCTLGSNLLLTWTGTDTQRRLNVMTFNGTNFFNKVTLGENSFTAPSIENINGRIVLGWTGTDSQRRLNVLFSTNGINFFGKQTFGDNSFFGPTVGGFNATPVIAWTGTDNARSLNTMTF